MSAPGQHISTALTVTAGMTVTRIVGRVSARNSSGLLQGFATPVRVAIYIRGVAFANLANADLTAESHRVKWATMLYPVVTTPTDQAGSVGDFPRGGVDHADVDVRGQYLATTTEQLRVHFQVASGPTPTPTWAVASYIRIFTLLP